MLIIVDLLFLLDVLKANISDRSDIHKQSAWLCNPCPQQKASL